MRRGRRCEPSVLCLSLSFLAFLAGCHSAGIATTTTTTPPAVTITLGAAPSSLSVGQTYQFSDTVANATNTGVTWAVAGVTGGNASVGTISASGLYTAPALVPTPQSVTISATSQADTTKSASTSVTINIALSVSLAGSGANTISLPVTSTQVFNATVLGAANTAVTWTVNGITNGNSTYGTITGSGLSVTYSAPAAVPSPGTFNVTATSVQDNTKSASVQFTITSAAPGTVTFTSPSSPASVARAGTLQITASVTGAAPNLTFTVNGVTGGNSSFGTITGSYPSYTYNAPTAIPGNDNPVTIVATQGGTGQTATLTVTINPSASTPNAILITGGNVNGVNLSLTSSTPTLGLADVGTCGAPNPNNECLASVTGIQVSRSGATTASCASATCNIWLLGQGLSDSAGTTVTAGLTVSVTPGSTTDVTVGTPSAGPVSPGLTAINFTITVSATAATGNRDLVVTLPDGEIQIYIGAIQIVN
jgi:hypothetical protein